MYGKLILVGVDTKLVSALLGSLGLFVCLFGMLCSLLQREKRKEAVGPRREENNSHTILYIEVIIIL